MRARLAIAAALLLWGVASAQDAPLPPPCQTIFLPSGKVIICCTTGSVTNCY